MFEAVLETRISCNERLAVPSHLANGMGWDRRGDGEEGVGGDEMRMEGCVGLGWGGADGMRWHEADGVWKGVVGWGAVGCDGVRWSRLRCCGGRMLRLCGIGMM